MVYSEVLTSNGFKKQQLLKLDIIELYISTKHIVPMFNL